MHHTTAYLCQILIAYVIIEFQVDDRIYESVLSIPGILNHHSTLVTTQECPAYEVQKL